MREPSGRAIGVETATGLITAGAVVVAAGVWTQELLEGCGLTSRSRPRKGQIVVLERSPVRFHRKLSEAGYVAAVEADDAALQIAMVVESTPSGTALLGSSRQHVGFDREVDLSVAGAIARRAARFFPILNEARALRVYAGLRPLTPDHMPIIGPFAEAPNICVATGHEGAGIGLAPATGELVAAWYTTRRRRSRSHWFSPDRFAPVELAAHDRAHRRRRAAARARRPEPGRGAARRGPGALRRAPRARRAGSTAGSASARSAACTSRAGASCAPASPRSAGGWTSQPVGPGPGTRDARARHVRRVARGATRRRFPVSCTARRGGPAMTRLRTIRGIRTPSGIGRIGARALKRSVRAP